MEPENTVINPFVVVTPKNKLSAFRIWSSLPPYRLRSIWSCKPVYLKKESILSSQISNSFWTITTTNDDYVEIIIQAHKDEVVGGFEKNGPPRTSWINFFKSYVLRSPSLWTVFLITLVLFVMMQFSGKLNSLSFLNEYPLYQKFPKAFSTVVKTRIIFWGVMVPSLLIPLAVGLAGILGLIRSKNGRVAAAVKVESWIMILVFLFLLIKVPILRIGSNWPVLIYSLDSPKLEKVISSKGQ